jgi:hypothetical protein
LRPGRTLRSLRTFRTFNAAGADGDIEGINMAFTGTGADFQQIIAEVQAGGGQPGGYK